MELGRFDLSHGDAVAFLQGMPSASVDLVVTDPPYESLEKHRAIGTTTRLKNSKASSNAWFEIFPNDRFEELFVEIYRVLRKNTHFYLYCDQETMFVAKPIAERIGFRFWKPIIWDKCLGPDTLVWSTRGTVRIDQLEVGDQVAIPEGGTTRVRAVRRTRAPALALGLSDGTELTASLDHRLVLRDGRQVEARQLAVGDQLSARPVKVRRRDSVRLDEVIPDSDAVYELPPREHCLFCEREFGSSRAASAHQARFCDNARSKDSMARELGITPKRLRRWFRDGRIPARWARQLGLENKLTSRVRCYLQNDSDIWFPESLALDYDLGKLVGLFAAEGHVSAAGIVFALHREEKHLRHHIERFARRLGVRAQLRTDGNRQVVEVNYKIARYLIEYFVGGSRAPNKFFKEPVYAAPDEFRAGVLAGLLEGDGSWSSDEQRETLNSSSADLATFAARLLGAGRGHTSIRRFENDTAGGWRVRHDPRPSRTAGAVTVESIRELGETDLVDISIEHSDELFLLANGVVSHNCKIGMGYHYRARYECILFFEKGKRKLNNLSIPDILECPRIYRGYPAEKPSAVSEILIGQSTMATELVVDPFMGSASVGEAAVKLGRDFAGNDICAEAVDVAKQRLLDVGSVQADVLTGRPGHEQPQLGLRL